MNCILLGVSNAIQYQLIIAVFLYGVRLQNPKLVSSGLELCFALPLLLHLCADQISLLLRLV